MAVGGLALRFPGLKFSNINKAQGGSPKAAQTLCSPQNRSVPRPLEQLNIITP